MITPNQFEAEKLSGVLIKDLESVKEAIKILHELGPSIVVITSTFFSGDENLIQLYASNHTSLLCCDIPKFPGHFTGTGDVLSSMLLTQMDL
jgi:pyridoxine kinase